LEKLEKAKGKASEVGPFEKVRGIKGLTKYSLISFSIVLFVFFIFLPVSSMFRYAFQDGFGGFLAAVSSKDAVQAFQNSLMLAALATMINLGVGILIAFTITRYKFPGRSVFKALIDMPIAIPASVVGLAMFMLYGPNGLLGPLMKERGIEVIWDLKGILLAHIFITFPFMVRAVSVSIEKVDISQEEAAMTLGASKLQTFWHVTLPSIRGGIIAGTALTFTRSLGEFGATLFIAGGIIKTAPIYIYYLTEAQIDVQGATSVAIVLMLFPFALLLILNYVAERLETGIGKEVAV
jgi:sulfate/thiosulfate transport system permease protein